LEESEVASLSGSPSGILRRRLGRVVVRREKVSLVDGKGTLPTRRMCCGCKVILEPLARLWDKQSLWESLFSSYQVDRIKYARSLGAVVDSVDWKLQ